MNTCIHKHGHTYTGQEWQANSKPNQSTPIDAVIDSDKHPTRNDQPIQGLPVNASGEQTTSLHGWKY